MAAAMAPKKPPQDMHYHEKLLRSSAPPFGYLRAYITIRESTITSEKAMLRFEMKSIQQAIVSVWACYRPSIIIVTN